MGTRHLTIRIDGASTDEYVRLANDLRAGLPEQPDHISVEVLTDGVALSRLNADFEDRYRLADKWTEGGRTARRRTGRTG